MLSDSHNYLDVLAMIGTGNQSFGLAEACKNSLLLSRSGQVA